MLSAQTSGTQIRPFAFAIYVYGYWLDVWKPATPCVLHRMAYFIAEMSCFTAKVAFCRQFYLLLNSVIGSYLSQTRMIVLCRQVWQYIIPKFAV